MQLDLAKETEWKILLSPYNMNNLAPHSIDSFKFLALPHFVSSAQRLTASKV
jgi:hypothetical protein